MSPSPPIDDTDVILSAIPVRIVEHEMESTQRATLLQPKSIRGPIGALIAKLVTPRHSRIKLDEIGTHVWTSMDGATSVRSIADALAQRFGTTVEPRYDRVAVFVRTMHQHRMINLKAPQVQKQET